MAETVNYAARTFDSGGPGFVYSVVAVLERYRETLDADGARSAAIIRRMARAARFIHDRGAFFEDSFWHMSYLNSDLFSRPTETAEGFADERTYGTLFFLILQICGYQSCFSFFDFSVFGAVGIGPHFQNQHFAFGPTLIECNRLCHEGIVPAVTVTESALAVLFAHEAVCPGESHCGGDVVVFDGKRWFVNYLHYDRSDRSGTCQYLRRHRASIRRRRHQISGGAEQTALQWMAEYHDWYCLTEHPQLSGLVISVENQQQMGRYRFHTLREWVGARGPKR